VSKRWEQILIVSIFFGVIAVLSIGGHVRPDRATSSLEQRTLAQRPAVRWADVVSGAFGTGLESYLSDQFPGRDRWVRYYTLLNLRLLGKVAMNGVVVGKGGVLLEDLSSHKELTDAQIGTELDATMAQFDELDGIVRSYGGKLLVVGHPTKNSFLRADYSAGFGFPADFDRVTARYFTALARHGIASVNMAPIFDRDRNQKLYYATDHHWTLAGAYLAYAATMHGLGMTPLAQDQLDEVTLPNAFVGSLDRKLAMAFPENEKVTIATPKVPIPYTRYQDGVVSPDFFRAHPAGASIAYGIFDQGDNAETVVDTNRPKLPSLLLVGDSFTNAMETLIWTGFDESRFVDLRYYTAMSLYAYVEKYKPDRVVILVRDERYLYRAGNGLFSGSTPGSADSGD
jgi:hypothetical protein